MTKTISFAIVHFSVALAAGYVMTGSVVVGGAIAMIEPAVNTVAYFFHEKVWERIRAHHPVQSTREVRHGGADSVREGPAGRSRSELQRVFPLRHHML